MNSEVVHIEIGAEILRALYQGAHLEIPLERNESGGLTPESQRRVESSLKDFVKRQPWQVAPRALCAVGGRGVSIRRLTLPATAREDLRKLLKLQIERELPLPEGDLAWGFQPLEDSRKSPGLPADSREFLIVALRKEIVQGYATLLARAGLNPQFTLAAAARMALLPEGTQSAAILACEGNSCELQLVEQGALKSLRTFPPDSESISARLSTELRDFSGTVYGIGTKEMPILPGGSTPAALPIDGASGDHGSPVLLGLKKAADGKTPLMTLSWTAPGAGQHLSHPEFRKWAAVAAILLLLALLAPYLEALVMKPFVARRIAAARASLGKLETIDRELSFLKNLKASQPPYVDAFYLLASGYPQVGMPLESITMNRAGDVSIRGSLRDSSQVTQLRDKLLGSGFFSSVVVEEQNPTPDRQRVILRMSAQWKSSADRERLKLGPTPEEMEKIKQMAKELGPPGASMGMGMMPGIPIEFLQAMPAMPANIQIQASPQLPPEIQQLLKSARPR